jgi:zinc/manganese transport system substrate-binding protein
MNYDLRFRQVKVFAVISLLIVVAAFSLVSCAAPSNTVTGGIIQVVAGENFWGSIAAQLGGSHAHVVSIVTDPNADPHEYETSSTDALAFSQADYVILNGAGYDTWGQKLLDANPVSGRKVLNIADLLGKKEGDNPHFWYNPDYVTQVADQITQDYQSLDPQDTQYFTQQHAAFENSLSQYYQLIVSIKQTYAGVKVGATESIFVYLASALGLDLVSPPAFMNAVSEGNDPPTPAVAQFQQQISQRQITILVYNIQTATLVTTNIKQLAASNDIPTVGISETVIPPDASFQDWQDAQLVALQNALNLSH